MRKFVIDVSGELVDVRNYLLDEKLLRELCNLVLLKSYQCDYTDFNKVEDEWSLDDVQWAKDLLSKELRSYWETYVNSFIDILINYICKHTPDIDVVELELKKESISEYCLEYKKVIIDCVIYLHELNSYNLKTVGDFLTMYRNKGYEELYSTNSNLLAMA